MKRLPCAKFTMRSTPKMSVRPAEMSHRYIASDRPMRPWKAMLSITRGQPPPYPYPASGGGDFENRTRPDLTLFLFRRGHRRERRMPVVVVGREYLQVAEYGDRVFRIHHGTPG